ncbi:MAG: hypothetical protein PHN56_00260 [Candidatus Nanoarchaeia archaeon]|nr:hypothetical protein [Candidatus Nanoarchaeia archaeon]
MNKIISLILISMLFIGNSFAVSISDLSSKSSINIVLQSNKPLDKNMDVYLKQTITSEKTSECSLVSSIKIANKYLATYSCKGNVLKPATVILSKPDNSIYEESYKVIGKIRTINLNKVVFSSTVQVAENPISFSIISAQCNLNTSKVDFYLMNRGASFNATSIVTLNNENMTAIQTSFIPISMDENEIKSIQEQYNLTQGRYSISVNINGIMNTAIINCI